MKLSVDFLKSNPGLTTAFVSGSREDKHEFFRQLQILAGQDLSLAHSTFKVSSCRTILDLSEIEKFQYMAKTNFVSSFSVYKTFDKVRVNRDSTIHGKKHWITNLAQAEFAIMQIKDSDDQLRLYFVDLQDLGNLSFIKDFSFFRSPGLADTCTGDIDFHLHPAQEIFSKSDPRYFVSSNHNSLCFIANYIGGASGLLQYLDRDASARFRSCYKNLCGLLHREIETTANITCGGDDFWHTRNALYLGSKNFMVEICKHIMTNSAGNFYNLNSPQGRHFFDCLVYSGHNGPIDRSYQQLFTEPQDY